MVGATASFDWSEHSVGDPVRDPQSCVQFHHVTHITHVDNAVAIINGGRIRAEQAIELGLGENLRVVWTSPNHWTSHSVYGNVVIVFPFSAITYGANVHYVGAVSEYVHTACRFLLSSSRRELNAYQPTIRNGPWWYDQASNTHSFNSHRTLHFVVDHDLSLCAAEEFRFTDHESCANPNSPCAGLRAEFARALFMARAVAEGTIRRPSARLIENSKTEWCLGWSPIERFITNVEIFTGNERAGSEAAKSTAIDVLDALADKDFSNMRTAGSRFASSNDLVSTVKQLVLNTFGISEEDLAQYT